MLERDLVKKIIDYLRQHDAIAYKNHGSVYMPTGLPDIVAILPYPTGYGGRVLMIETKNRNKKATPVQKAWLSDVRRSGGLAFQVDNWPAAKTVLDLLFNEN